MNTFLVRLMALVIGAILVSSPIAARGGGGGGGGGGGVQGGGSAAGGGAGRGSMGGMGGGIGRDPGGKRDRDIDFPARGFGGRADGRFGTGAVGTLSGGLRDRGADSRREFNRKAVGRDSPNDYGYFGYPYNYPGYPYDFGPFDQGTAFDGRACGRTVVDRRGRVVVVNGAACGPFR